MHSVQLMYGITIAGFISLCTQRRMRKMMCVFVKKTNFPAIKACAGGAGDNAALSNPFRHMHAHTHTHTR